MEQASKQQGTLNDVRRYVEEGHTVGLFPASELGTTYALCKLHRPDMPEGELYYCLTVKGVGRPYQEWFQHWDQLMKRVPRWPMVSHLWEVM